MKLLTVREYAKYEGISDQAVRKRLNTGNINTIQLDGVTHVIVEDNSGEIIKELRAKIRLLNSNVRALKAQAATVIKQDDEIKYLRDRVRILEDDLRASTKKKEELYESVITFQIAAKSENTQ